MRTCETEGCSASLEGMHHSKRFCMKCAKIRAKAQMSAGGKEHRARKAGTVTKTCACGAELPKSQARCAPCKEIANKAAKERKNKAKRDKLAARRATLPPQEKHIRIVRPRLTNDEKWRAEMARSGCVQFTPDRIAEVWARGEIRPIHLIPHWHFSGESSAFQ